MDKKSYDELTKKILPKNLKMKKLIIAFFVGGIIGVLGQVLIYFYSSFEINSYSDSVNLMMISLIFVASLLTGIGVFDELIEKLGAGLIIPITGFAHATTSSAMEYRKEGLVFGIGSNIFKLSGSVILYGVVTSHLVALIKYIFIGG